MKGAPSQKLREPMVLCVCGVAKALAIAGQVLALCKQGLEEKKKKEKNSLGSSGKN